MHPRSDRHPTPTCGVDTGFPSFVVVVALVHRGLATAKLDRPGAGGGPATIPRTESVS